MMKNTEHEQSIADPCMYFSWDNAGELAIWLNWIDNNLIVGPFQVMKDECKKVAKEIEIKYVGKLKEFTGFKTKINKLEKSAKYTLLS